MNRSAEILDRLQDELGFAPELVGGRESVLTQIERVLSQKPAAEGESIESAAWEQLVAEVVVPETSFLRYPESFAALAAWARTRPEGSLRILCLPCSSGEEAYSIALTLLREDIANFHVTAGDASGQSLAQAKAGRYSSHRLRHLPADEQDRWFPEGSAADTLRARIDFCATNIFTFAPGTACYDAIFCRNLLIYFDAARQRQIYERLHHWLTPGGILFLGPGEATVAASFGWQNTGQSMAFAFTRSAPSATPRARPAPARPRPPVAPPPARAITPVSDVPPDHLFLAENFANEGRLDASADSLARFHGTQPPTADSLLLRGILEEATGDLDAAEASYRKALYLHPDQLEPLLHLSLLLESSGRAEAARPLRQRIARLAPPP